MSNMTIDERNYYRKHGICTVCGKEKAQEDGYLCEACYTKRRAYYANLSPEKKREYSENLARYRKEQREFRKKHGICPKCGKRPASKDHYCCKECLLKASEWRYRAKAKQEKNGGGIMTKDAKAILDFIVQNRTFDQQLEQAVEEASEFILAAQKWKRYRGDTEWANLTEETADVRICMEQMRWYIDRTAVDIIVAEKLEREKQRILYGDKEAYGRK